MAKDFADISRLELAQDRNEAKRDAVSKMVKVWESKNAKRALQGAGLSTMAVTLAACGGSSTTPAPADPAPADPTPVAASLTIGNDVVVGTSTADSISGARIDTIQTWNSGDSLNGGDGVDTLTAVISASVSPNTGAVVGVEKIVVTALGAATVDFGTATSAAISGVTEVTNIGSTAALTLADVQAVPVINIENAVAAATTTVSIIESALTGSADALTINVNGVLGAVAVGQVGAINGTGIETLTINGSGAASSFSLQKLV